MNKESLDFTARDGVSVGLILVLLGLAMLLALGSGCGALVGYCGANVLEVVNSSTHDVTISANGNPLTFKFDNGKKSNLIPPGESVKLRYGQTMALVVKFYDHGYFVGVATHKRYADDYEAYGYRQREANVLVLRDQDIDKTGTTGNGLLGW